MSSSGDICASNSIICASVHEAVYIAVAGLLGSRRHSSAANYGADRFETMGVAPLAMK